MIPRLERFHRSYRAVRVFFFRTYEGQTDAPKNRQNGAALSDDPRSVCVGFVASRDSIVDCQCPPALLLFAWGRLVISIIIMASPSTSTSSAEDRRDPIRVTSSLVSGLESVKRLQLALNFKGWEECPQFRTKLSLGRVALLAS
eukprot:scaffold11145_cov42-Attheya_sp.AAC.3